MLPFKIIDLTFLYIICQRTVILWQDVICGKQKLKPLFPRELGHTSENLDMHEGELGRATIALFTKPMFGESISKTILK